MSCTLSHECRVMLSSLLTASTDATRVWLRTEMDRTVDPMLHSIFNRLTTKLTNGLGQTQSAGDGDCAQVGNRNLHDQSTNVRINQFSTSSHFNPEFVNLHQQQNGQIQLEFISNQQLSSQSQPMTIKEEIEPMPTHQVQSSSNAPVSNEQSNHNLTDQHPNNNEEWENSQVNFPGIEMQPQPQQLVCIKHNQFDDEECDCEECVDGGIEVKEENDEDDGQVNDESSRPVKKPKMDTTESNNAIHSNFNCEKNVTVHNSPVASPSCHDLIHQQYNRMCTGTSTTGTNTTPNGHQQIFDLSHHLLTQYVPQQTYSITSNKEIDNEEENENVDNNEVNKCDGNEVVSGLIGEEGRMGSEHSKVIDSRMTIGDYSRDNSDYSMVIQQEERDANNAIGEEIATECTTNPIQPNLAQPNRQWQCSLCLKSFNRNSNLQIHLRVHTGERPFQCKQCDKQFKDRSTLAKHQLIHQNRKRFWCHECEKQFNRNDHFQGHLLTHSGVRPFECRHCEMSFTQVTNRNNHEQAIHLHVKPYRCKQCGHTATTQSTIITHIRVVHFGLPPTTKQQRARNIVDDRDPRELVEKV